MNDLLQQLIALSPGIVSGIRGNGHGMSAFMDSYLRTNALLDENERRQQQMQVQRDEATAQRTRQTRLDQQAADAETRAKEDQQWQNFQRSIAALQGMMQAGGSAESPQAGEQAVDAIYSQAPPSIQQGLAPSRDAAIASIQPQINARQKRQVSEFVEKALKTSYVADNPDADPEVTNLPEHIQKVIGKPSAKLSELQMFAQLPVGKPSKPPSAEVSLQSKELLGPDGKMHVYNFNPKTGAYDQVAGVSPQPPAPKAGDGQAYPPNVQRRIDAVIKGFDTQPTVRTIQKQAEAVQFADGLDPNTTNPADDQGLIYAFAKAMDPDSVVREGEYNTVQKYAQSWAENLGFNAQRIFSNTAFLTPQARANMKATIRARYLAGRSQYDNLRSEYGKRIDRITNATGGVDQLTDYGAGFPQDQAQQTAAPKFKVGQKVRNKKTGEVREVTGVQPDGTPILGPVKQ